MQGRMPKPGQSYDSPLLKALGHKLISLQKEEQLLNLQQAERTPEESERRGTARSSSFTTSSKIIRCKELSCKRVKHGGDERSYRLRWQRYPVDEPPWW